MLDAQLVALVGQRMEAAIAAIGLGDIGVVQKDQPTQQGTASGPNAYFQKLFDIPRGWPVTTYFTDEVAKLYVERTTQQLETVFQISAFCWQDPELPTEQVVTASDIANQILMFFVAKSQLRELGKLGVRILRVTQVRNDPFENDDHRFEYAPSFDITFVHTREIDIGVPIVSMVEGDVIVGDPAGLT